MLSEIFGNGALSTSRWAKDGPYILNLVCRCFDVNGSHRQGRRPRYLSSSVLNCAVRGHLCLGSLEMLWLKNI